MSWMMGVDVTENTNHDRITNERGGGTGAPLLLSCTTDCKQTQNTADQRKGGSSRFQMPAESGRPVVCSLARRRSAAVVCMCLQYSAALLLLLFGNIYLQR